MTIPGRRLLAILLAASTLGGCTGYRHIAVGPARPAPPVSLDAIRVGQTVYVQLRDAPSRTITVKAIDADALVGTRGERLVRAQIVAIARPTTLGGHLRRLALLYGAVILLQIIVFGLYEDE